MYEYEQEQEFFGSDKPVPVPVIIGILIAAFVLLERLVTLGEISAMGWTELVLAGLYGTIGGAVAWLILRAVSYFINPRQEFTAEDVARAILDMPLDLDPISGDGLDPDAQQPEPEPVIVRFGSRPITVEPELADALEEIKRARRVGQLEQVSKRRLEVQAGIDRYGKLAQEVIDLLFAEGMIRLEGNNIYRWTDKGDLYFEANVI